jgi:hypothetical protein
MDIHKNARLTPHSRAELVRRVLAGQGPKAPLRASPFSCPRREIPPARPVQLGRIML